MTRGELALSYNGEIYNYVELREELKERGHSFRTDTDTEVLLAAYAEWGQDCVNHFDGMWSFAVLDKEREELFCSRDRFGEKPFYWHLANSDLPSVLPCASYTGSLEVVPRILPF